MLITVTLYHVVTRETWRWSRAKADAVFALGIVTILPFVAANTLKFFDGGYLPVAIGVAMLLVMWVWKVGRGLVAENLAERSAPAPRFLDDVRAKSLGRVPGVGIYLSSQPNDIPPTLTRAFERFRTLHHKTVILTVMTARAPYVPAEDRLAFEDLGQGVFRVILHFGFMDAADVPAALAVVPFLEDTDASTPVFVMGHERFLATPANRMGGVSEGFFAFLARNARNATDDFHIPPAQVVEVGTHIDL